MSAVDANDTAALVVVNFGSSELLATNLAGMTLPPDTLVVVVDNFHSPAERRAARDITAQRNWTLVCSDTNVGFGAAVNRGVERAAALGATTFVIINPDAWAGEDVLAALFAQCRDEPMTLVSPRIERADGRAWFVGGAVVRSSGHLVRNPDFGDGRPDGWLTGACLGISLELFGVLRGFDERYFLYWEDVDLSRRCLGAGGALRVRDDLTARHDVGGTQPGGGGSSKGKSVVYVYYNCRNRLLFASQHLDRRTKIGWLVRTPVVSVRILLRSGPRLAVRQPRQAWAALRGSAVGAALVVRSLLRP